MPQGLDATTGEGLRITGDGTGNGIYIKSGENLIRHCDINSLDIFFLKRMYEDFKNYSYEDATLIVEGIEKISDELIVSAKLMGIKIIRSKYA